MKKTTLRRIVLTRETLRALEGRSLSAAHGGLTLGGAGTCNVSCASDGTCPEQTCYGTGCHTAGSMCC
jgi:hypothetical protein